MERGGGVQNKFWGSFYTVHRLKFHRIFNKSAYKMRIFGHVQTASPPLYAFVCISVDIDVYVIIGRPL